MINSLIANSLTKNEASTIADGVDEANLTLGEIKTKLDKFMDSTPITDDSMKNDGVTKSILVLFKKAIKEYDIIPLLNADPESELFYELISKNVANSFLEAIKRDVVTKYVANQDDKIYVQVRAFAERLERYCEFIRERVDIAENGIHFILKHEESDAKNLIEAVTRKRTGREEVRGLQPQKPSIFDGEGILRVRKIDILYHEITGEHFLYGTKWGGWVDRDLADEAAEELINSLGYYESQKESISEQMVDIFRYAIDKCQIINYIKSDPTHRLEFPVVQIDYFKFTMENLFDKYRHHQKEEVFGDIYRFYDMLQEYNSYLSCNLWPLHNGTSDIYVPNPPGGRAKDTKGEQEFADNVLEYRKAINELYGKVCIGETMFV